MSCHSRSKWHLRERVKVHCGVGSADRQTVTGGDGNGFLLKKVAWMIVQGESKGAAIEASMIKALESSVLRAMWGLRLLARPM